MECTVTLTANAGCIIDLDGLRILLDALHDTPTGGFASLSPEMVETLFSRLRIRPPDFILLTHLHPDHYSPALTQRALDAFPGAALILPRQAGHMELGGAKIEWFPLRHQRDLGDNYGYIIRCGGCTLFTAGDADPVDSSVISRIAGLEPDLALLSFPWLTLRRGRGALAGMAPKNLVLFHLPFRSSDCQGYLAATEAAAGQWGGKSVILSEFLQTAQFQL